MPRHDLEVSARASPGGVRALPVPLQPAAGIDERAVFLGEAGGRQTEHLGLDLAGIDVVVLAEIRQNSRGLRRQRIHDDEELQLRERRGRSSPCSGRRPAG